MVVADLFCDLKAIGGEFATVVGADTIFAGALTTTEADFIEAKVGLLAREVLGAELAEIERRTGVGRAWGLGLSPNTRGFKGQVRIFFVSLK